MRNKRRFKKEKSKVYMVIQEHINKNIKEYSIAVLVFLIGIIIGIMLINSSNTENKNNISGYINEFIQSIKNKEYEIDEKKLLIKSILSNIKIAGLIWISGSTLIGIPLIYGALGYKGICIGYSISAIIATLPKGKGLIFALSSMLPQNVIVVPCILALCVSSIKMHNAIMQKQKKESIKSEIYRHSIFSLIMVIGLCLSSLIEIFFSTSITSNIIMNFI